MYAADSTAYIGRVFTSASVGHNQRQFSARSANATSAIRLTKKSVRFYSSEYPSNDP